MADEGNNTAAVETTPQATETPAATEPQQENLGEALTAPTEENPSEAPAIPEKYEFNLPEGLQLTPEIESQFTEIAKATGMTQEQANGLIKLHSDLMLDVMQQATKQKAAWESECKKAGLTSPEKLQLAKNIINTFDNTGEVMRVLVESGAAYHPAVLGMLQEMGSLLQEDSAPDSKPAPQAKSAADLLFGNSKYQLTKGQW
jgi:hypothetical protein